jgi:hypothetical protein
MLQLLQRIQGFLPPPALADAALHRVFGALERQD